MRKRKYTDQQFIEAVLSSKSVAEVLSKLQLSPTGGSYKLFHMRVKKLNIDTSHFTGKGHLKGKTHNWSPKIPIEDILIDGSTYQTRKLKDRLIKEGYFKNACFICGIDSWLDNPIILELHHINGKSDDHRLNNLQLICPNCHSQTDNFCGKNINKSTKLTDTNSIN